MIDPHESIPTAEAALERVKRELLAAKLSDKRVVQDLRCREAHRRTYATADAVRTLVTRKMTVGEEPLQTQPTGPSINVSLWESAWPPATEQELVSRTIDLRQSYEIVPCARCSTAGRNPCGVCRGSGQVADAKNPRKAVTCTICRGQGTVTCPQCKGYGRLNRFSRIFQTVKKQKTKIDRPEGCLGMPKAHPAGQFAIDRPLGFRTNHEAGRAIVNAAGGLNPERVEEFTAEICEAEEPVDSPTRVGWLGFQARWYDGWELFCSAGGKPRNYFVPDTSAGFVGPRLHSSAKLLSLGAAALGIVLTIGAVSSYRAAHQREAEAAALVAESTRQKAEKEAHIQALKSDLPAAIQEIDAAIDVTAIGTSQDALLKEQRLIALKRGLERFGELQPTPPGVVEEQKKLASVIDVLRNLREATVAATEAADATRLADQRIAAGAWLEADDLYAKAIGQWGKHPELMAAIKTPNKDGKMANLNPAAEKANVEKKRQRIAPQVARERARIEAEKRRDEKEQATAAALAALCGDKPVCSAWDGECIGIKSAIKRVAHDPDSIDVENCTGPVLTDDNCWVTTCDVRGKNAFGALILNRKKFSMSKLGVSEL